MGPPIFVGQAVGRILVWLKMAMLKTRLIVLIAALIIVLTIGAILIYLVTRPEQNQAVKNQGFCDAKAEEASAYATSRLPGTDDKSGLRAEYKERFMQSCLDEFAQ